MVPLFLAVRGWVVWRAAAHQRRRFARWAARALVVLQPPNDALLVVFVLARQRENHLLRSHVLKADSACLSGGMGGFVAWRYGAPRLVACSLRASARLSFRVGSSSINFAFARKALFFSGLSECGRSMGNVGRGRGGVEEHPAKSSSCRSNS